MLHHIQVIARIGAELRNGGLSSDTITAVCRRLERLRRLEAPFLGTVPVDDMPDPSMLAFCFIANYDRGAYPGVHWVAICAPHLAGEREAYYDPLGYKVDELDAVFGRAETAVGAFKRWLTARGLPLSARHKSDMDKAGDYCGVWSILALTVGRERLFEQLRAVSGAKNRDAAAYAALVDLLLGLEPRVRA